MSDKIHKRVAEVLGMELSDEDEDEVDEFDSEYNPISESAALVPVPENAVEVDNPELPILKDEMIRIEHGLRQTETLLNKGIPAVANALGEIALLPPVYKARAMEAAAELLKAVGDLSKFKVEVQIKLADMKLKQAAFTRNKSTQPTSPLGTGNTFVFNREDVMRVINQQIKKVNEPDTPDEPDDDDEDQS